MTKLKNYKKLNATNVVIWLVVILVLLSIILMFLKNNIENFESPEDNIINNVNRDLESKTEDELKSTINVMRERLVKYGLLPDKMQPEIDRSQWVPKSQIPPAGPRIDMSQYVKKSSIPPEKICPPQKQIDYSQYVKKSTLPPTQKCPACIAPKVKVSAGLCKKCPSCPSCPPPTRCPTVTCPEPKPVVQEECAKCTEIKYIKVPTIITRTIIKDNNNNVIEEKEETTTTKANVKPRRKKTPTTTQPEEEMKVDDTTRQINEDRTSKCNAYGLNSAFKRFGIYGPVN